MTSMRSAAIADTVRSQPRLTTLPRETRNEIYRNLVVSSKPIKVCYDHDSSCLYLRASRNNEDVSIEFLCHAIEGSELAQETYEEFFRNNIFDCSCQDLRGFLTTATARFNSQDNLVPITMNHGCLKFRKMPWIRRVKISIYNDIFEHKPSEHLTYLLKCPRLQQVEITVFGLDNKFDEIKPVDRTLEAIARVCKTIREKIAGGLVVKVQRTWSAQTSIIGNPEQEDVSWMWEEPSEGAKARVGTDLATHKDKIQLLMSAGWCGQMAKEGAWLGRALTS